MMIVQSIQIGIQNLLESPTGLIFLFTIGINYLGISVYYGFLGRLAGGLGSASAFGRDFSIGDFISLFPMMVITIIRIALDNIFQYIIRVFVFLLLPVFGSFVIVFYAFGTRLIENISPEMTAIGILLIFITIVLSYFGMEKWNKKQIIFFIIQMTFSILGYYLLLSSEPSVIEAVSQNNYYQLFIQVLNLFPPLAYLIVFFLFPFIFGFSMAEFAIENKSFNKISTIILKNQIIGIGNYSLTNSRSLTITPKWFGKKEEIHLNEPVYLLEPEIDIYFIGEHRNWILLYKAQKEFKKENSLFMIDRDQIISMELVKQPKKEDSK